MVTIILVISLLFSFSCKQNFDTESNVSYINFNMSGIPSDVTITKYSLKIEPTSDNLHPEQSVKVNEIDKPYEAGTSLNTSLTPTGEYQLELSLSCTTTNNSKERECYKTKTPYKFNTVKDGVALKQITTDGLKLSPVKAQDGDNKIQAEQPSITTEDVPTTTVETENNTEEQSNQDSKFSIMVHATIVDK